MLLISEQDYQILQAVVWGGIIWFGVSLVLVRHFLFARIREKFGRGKIILRADSDGRARFYNQKIDMGYFIGSDSHTQVAAERVVRTDDGDIFLHTDGFGLSYDLDIVSASAALERMGFLGLKDALNKYDELFFSEKGNKEKLEQVKKDYGLVGSDFDVLEAVRRDKIDVSMKSKYVAVKRLVEDARTRLIRFDVEWVNDWTIPLALNYRWGLQNQGSMNNKNLYEKGVLLARKEAVQQGWTQEKMQGFAVIALTLLIGGAIAVLILYSSGAIHSVGGSTTTTTMALAENITRVARNVSM